MACVVFVNKKFLVRMCWLVRGFLEVTIILIVQKDYT